MHGDLSRETEVGQGRIRIGSRTASEHATCLIEAIDGGIGGVGALYGRTPGC
jgi:hypothetical protein